MKQITVSPNMETMNDVLAFVEDSLNEFGCPMKIVMKMGVAVDELYSNIVRYSGASEASVGCSLCDGVLTLRFADNGKPYDPTRKETPDTALSSEEREIGGLGIHIVRTFMDALEYEYADGKNILTIRKTL